ncbi:MarR family winged helix-turn-helix transcriptional regulator [Psychromonas algicola]|uniref:MarR family winged helix-turn-helix transcriptional regulator n=1 Tax=Psychromonas algicola TaxID=2555642 RepID=UPI001067278B|nr:MarR family transcriptional regulator [Psychromonas sp. RZ5]TEW48508.1 MarR family transcriptional regulator [Psychromonas sp. RZ5]
MKSESENLNHAFIEFYEKLSSWELKIVKDKGVSLTLIHAVEILGAFGSMPMKELANKVGVTTGTLTVLVDNLTKAKLVERVPHGTDRRSILVKLTDQGTKLFQEHDALHLNLTKQLTAGFNEEEIQLLNKLMSRVNNAF